MLVVGEGLGDDLAIGGAARRVVVARKERPRDGKGTGGQRESEKKVEAAIGATMMIGLDVSAGWRLLGWIYTTTTFSFPPRSSVGPLGLFLSGPPIGSSTLYSRGFFFFLRIHVSIRHPIFTMKLVFHAETFTFYFDLFYGKVQFFLFSVFSDDRLQTCIA
jgi:hypothetical protein